MLWLWRTSADNPNSLGCGLTGTELILQVRRGSIFGAARLPGEAPYSASRLEAQRDTSRIVGNPYLIGITEELPVIRSELTSCIVLTRLASISG
jgi:hypothetical protein